MVALAFLVIIFSIWLLYHIEGKRINRDYYDLHTEVCAPLKAEGFECDCGDYHERNWVTEQFERDMKDKSLERIWTLDEAETRFKELGLL